MKEQWKPVRGKEEYAEISNYGQIHYFAGKSTKYPDERFTCGSESGDYLYASIGGVVKGVHIWVYMTFNDCDIPEGLEVNHLDENKHNNCVWNLNLMSHGDNVRYGTGIARRAAAQRGKPKPKVSAVKRGKPNPKVSAALRGRKRPDVAVALSKPVQALDKVTGEVVYEFPSTQEAQRQGFNAGNITNCCNGNRKTHKGFIWRYKENAQA